MDPGDARTRKQGNCSPLTQEFRFSGLVVVVVVMVVVVVVGGGGGGGGGGGWPPSTLDENIYLYLVETCGNMAYEL